MRKTNTFNRDSCLVLSQSHDNFGNYCSIPRTRNQKEGNFKVTWVCIVLNKVGKEGTQQYPF